MGGSDSFPVGVIGAGGSGILAATALRAKGVPFEVLEARDGVGGTWHYGEGSAAYDSLVMNTTRLATSPKVMRIPGAPWRYATRPQMHRYMERLVEREGLREEIRLNWPVERASFGEDGWTLGSGSEDRRYRAIVCALGTNGQPRFAPVEGSFAGEQLHSAEYRNPERFAGRDVLVVGLGTSGCEVAGELVGHARSVHVAVRSPLWLMTRRLGGIPIDWIDNEFFSRVLPWSLRRRILQGLCELTTGSLRRHGVPRPTRRCGEDIIGISDTFPAAVKRGRMTFHGGLARAEGNRVHFLDGSEAEIEAIVHATGFEPPTGFLPPPARPDRYGLFRRVLHVGVPGLYFVGLFEAHRALLGIAESQANWAAGVLAGEISLPAPAEREAQARAEGERTLRDFGERHPFFLDWARYKGKLRREGRVGRAA
ncbi:MAG TPA: NAD(P)/FAD-dependent oxidoreductase [Solirubrobacteraceae bacterium]|nr:NAD(P)/FAD-dependent oxidoreductase [Solirubrobacteraceae bacterium]